MAYPEIDLIINTTPKKIEYLRKCLFFISQQTFKNFSLIVVNDGNDEETKNLIDNYSKKFFVTYNSRSNDLCVSRSRNIGYSLAKTEKLVFIDGDVLLNPFAIANYKNHLEKKNTCFWGKYGIVYQQISEKNIHDRREVFSNKLIKKYLEEKRRHFWLYLPYIQGWSGNFGLRKEVYQLNNGFDESFLGWGWEDLDFSLRLYQKGIGFKFIGDVWGIHLLHDKEGDFYSDQSFSKNSSIFSQRFSEEFSNFLNLPDEIIFSELSYLEKIGLIDSTKKEIIRNSFFQARKNFSGEITVSEIKKILGK